MIQIPNEVLLAIVSLIVAFAGFLWQAFKAIMRELKVQTITLTILNERSNCDIIWRETAERWRELAEHRISGLEAWRNRQTGILSVEITNDRPKPT